MEEILKRLESLGSASTESTASAEDDLSHKDLYKNWGKYGNQEERRNEILRRQKSNRENHQDNFRGILNLMDYTEQRRYVFRNSSQAQYQPTIHVPGFNNSSSFYYKNVLMLSEWMVEKPDNFSKNWYMAPCPKGTRTLVVASNGVTRFYTKYGQLIRTTSSLLPGGNRIEMMKNGSVLDGFYCKDTNTMYVLDILSWKGHIMADGEMEFRRFWLDTKFFEAPQLRKRSKSNRDSYVLLPMIPCDTASMQKFLMEYPPLESTKLDGLLFYHKHGHYVAGETPLVGWLYPYMVPEVLCPDVKIHACYALEKPIDYINQAAFIKRFEEKYSKKRNPFNGRKNSQSPSENSMEAVDSSVQENTDENDNATGNTVTMETENGVNETNSAQEPIPSTSFFKFGEPSGTQPRITK